jgi:hypothetical protein
MKIFILKRKGKHRNTGMIKERPQLTLIKPKSKKEVMM